MKRIIFTLSVIIAAGLASTAYSQVSFRASINLGHAKVYVQSSPVVYEPVCTPPPPPVCNDNVYGRERVAVVVHDRYRRDYDRYNDRYDNRHVYNDRDRRDRDRRDYDHDRDHDRGRNW